MYRHSYSYGCTDSGEPQGLSMKTAFSTPNCSPLILRLPGCKHNNIIIRPKPQMNPLVLNQEYPPPTDINTKPLDAGTNTLDMRVSD